MTVEEFESQYRESLDRVLNQLQTATLLLARTAATINEVAISVQTISQDVEVFIDERKNIELKSKSTDTSLVTQTINQKALTLR